MYKTTKALVLREVRYKEADRMLSLMTSDEGLITAKARGALRKTSRTSAATEQLCYSELTLFGNRGRWTVNEGTVLDSFDGLKKDISALALGCYFAQCVEALALEDQPDEPLMRLGLNSLYALSRFIYPQEHIKAAFELRLMILAGYEPELGFCRSCGAAEPERPLLLLNEGGICCRDCRRAEMGESILLSSGCLQAMRYIINSDDRHFMSFRIDDADLKILSKAAERYALAHMGRSFPTLDYWKSVK